MFGQSLIFEVICWVIGCRHSISKGFWQTVLGRISRYIQFKSSSSLHVHTASWRITWKVQLSQFYLIAYEYLTTVGSRGPTQACYFTLIDMTQW